MRLLRHIYRPGVGIGAAFAATLATLFADEGLLLFDPRDARIAALAAPLYRVSIENAARIEAGLRARQASLAAAGLEVQVPVREHSALVFFHPDTPAGPRFRLLGPPSPGHGRPSVWRLAGSPEVIAQDDLLATLAREPMRFSTSALLRPIVQDILFPTAAWVVGPGEINYAAQLGPLYAEAGLAPPLLVPRARFCMVDARSRRRLAQLGLTVSDLAAPQVLRARLHGELRDSDLGVEDLRLLVETTVEPALARMAAALCRQDLGLQRSVERTSKAVRHALGRLLARYGQALFERDAVMRRRLGELETALAPTGVAQERFYAWPALAGRVSAFKELVMREVAGNPFATGLREVAV
jgi:uncharacterized protein YllA (UPF0747 family)